MGERKASLLRNDMREFLEIEGEPGDSDYERSMKSQIHTRVREGIRDLQLLIKASERNRVDLSEVMTPEKTPAQKARSEVDDTSPPAWPLAALLFAWTEDFGVSLFSDEGPRGPSSMVDQRAEMIDQQTEVFDMQVERGVREALLIEEDQKKIVNKVENTLSVSLGPEMSELADSELVALPPHMLDQLLHDGQLNRERYARLWEKRMELIESGKLDPRPPVGNVGQRDIEDFEDLKTFLDTAVAERSDDGDRSPSKEDPDNGQQN